MGRHDQALRGALDGDRAKFRGRLGRIPAGALRMQILGLPTEADRTATPKYFGLAFDLDRQRHEILCSVHLDKFRMEMQHNACFALAGVNSMLVLVGVEQRVHVNQPRPHRRYREHAELDAQIAANNLEQLRLTAVRIEKQYLADAGAVHPSADVEPEPP